MNTLQPDIWDALCSRLGINLQPAPQVERQPTTSSRSTPLAPNKQVAIELFAPKGDGNRTTSLTALAGTLFADGLGLEAVTAVCRRWNAGNTPPMDDAKVIATCVSIEASDRTNHPERAAQRDQAVLKDVPLFDLRAACASRFIGVQAPPRRWVLKGFLPLGIAAVVVSPGGTGKSQLLMQLAYSVVGGKPLAGHWPVEESGSVLMLCAEDDEAELHRRYERIQAQMGPVGASHQLYIRSTLGENTLMTALGAGRSGELKQTIWTDRLVKTLAGIPDIKLVILDPASRFRGGEENSNEDSTRFVEALEFIVKASGATVLIAHHSNKATIQSKDEAHQGQARGASALTDGVRWQLALTTVSTKHPQYKRLQAQGEGRYLEAALVKSNYTAPQAAVYLRSNDAGYLGATLASATPGASPPELLALLRLIDSNPSLTARQIENHHCGAGKAVPLSQRQTRELIAQARQQGLLRGANRDPLKLTADGIKTLGGAPSLPAPPARKAGAARHRHTPR